MLLDIAFDPMVGGQASPASAGEAFFICRHPAPFPDSMEGARLLDLTGTIPWVTLRCPPLHFRSLVVKLLRGKTHLLGKAGTDRVVSPFAPCARKGAELGD